MKTKSTKYYVISFDDISQPSRNGIGFETQIIADSEEEARDIFEDAYPDCEIQEVREDNFAIVEHRMTLNAYQRIAMTTCMESSRNVEYMFLNLIGEVGELAEKLRQYATEYETVNACDRMSFLSNRAGEIAKRIRKGQHEVFKPIDIACINEERIDDMKKEAGDVLWQLSGLCSVFGWSLEDVAQMNIDKLAARKKAGTIDGNGDGVDGKERTV